ncbi:MAG: SgcJ/EcaC family oxidoreductase [Mycobacteriaceae bacterium]|nr:SgcJ/EcaC family oxidoreductase [Mycobacteriaceae bacterium]
MADDLSGSIPSDPRVDEDAIRELLDRQVMGWHAGDPEAYARVFTLDADYITFLGSHYKGREAIAASYAPLFKKLLKGSRLNTEITQLRFLTSDVALIQANADVTKGARRRNRRNTRVNTTIAVRTDDGWLLAASQNTTHRLFAEKLVAKLVLRKSHK